MCRCQEVVARVAVARAKQRGRRGRSVRIRPAQSGSRSRRTARTCVPCRRRHRRGSPLAAVAARPARGTAEACTGAGSADCPRLPVDERGNRHCRHARPVKLGAPKPRTTSPRQMGSRTAMQCGGARRPGQARLDLSRHSVAQAEGSHQLRRAGQFANRGHSDELHRHRRAGRPDAREPVQHRPGQTGLRRLRARPARSMRGTWTAGGHRRREAHGAMRRSTRPLGCASRNALRCVCPDTPARGAHACRAAAAPGNVWCSPERSCMNRWPGVRVSRYHYSMTSAPAAGAGRRRGGAAARHLRSRQAYRRRS